MRQLWPGSAARMALQATYDWANLGRNRLGEQGTI
jgi:hypothetical protein